jgi:hypothetical protein
VSSAHAQEISCDPPAVAERDMKGNPYCAEPNVSCYEDYPPTYGGNGIWLCPSIEEVQAAQRLKAGPKISCPMGAVIWNAKVGNWSCEQMTECQICERCFDYVELAKMQCVEKSRRVAWAKCNGTYGSTWRGERVPANGRVCEKRMIQDETSGRTHTIETNCTGPAIDECVKGWEVSHPGESSGSSRSGSVSYKVGAKAGGKILGIGVEVSGERATQDTEGESYSVTWGGGKGFLAACDEGADKVAALCSDCSGVCGEQ